jgi:KaiC/GvpD/RAD55 family RecA-like ATPase
MKEPHNKGQRAPPTGVSPVLPPELVEFMRHRSYSLLVKGEAATGKTTLAISILKALGPSASYLYLSTRVSPSQLFEDHPWLNEFAQFVVPKEGEEESDGQKPERFVDARLDEPVPFFERITNELMDARSPTIVIDSWDPIGTMMGDDASLSNAKVLQTWRERADAKIVMLIESSEDATFDSLFGGVVSLDKYYDDGRIVRLLQLSKLSGVKINRPSSVFTLEGGVFQSFSPSGPLEFEQKGRSPVWTWEKRSRSTGYPELDGILDGTLPSGTLVNLELSPGVNSATALLLLSGMLARNASRSSVLLFKPFEGIGAERAKSVLGDLVPVEPASGKPRRHAAEEDALRSLKAQVKRLRTGQRGKRVLAIVGSEMLSEVGGTRARESIYEYMKSAIDLSIIVGRLNGTDDGSAPADLSFKLSEVDGTPVLQPRLPWTEYFAIKVSGEEKQPKVSMVPIV